MSLFRGKKQQRNDKVAALKLYIDTSNFIFSVELFEWQVPPLSQC